MINKYSFTSHNHDHCRGIDALQTEGGSAADWVKVDLSEVLKLMEDLIEYFSQPSEDQGIPLLNKKWNLSYAFLDFEQQQNRFRALRSRQDLFQEEGVLNMILDTIDKFSLMESLPDFSGLVGEHAQVWEIS